MIIGNKHLVCFNRITNLLLFPLGHHRVISHGEFWGTVVICIMLIDPEVKGLILSARF